MQNALPALLVLALNPFPHVCIAHVVEGIRLAFAEMVCGGNAIIVQLDAAAQELRVHRLHRIRQPVRVNHLQRGREFRLSTSYALGKPQMHPNRFAVDEVVPERLPVLLRRRQRPVNVVVVASGFRV